MMSSIVFFRKIYYVIQSIDIGHSDILSIDSFKLAAVQ